MYVDDVNVNVHVYSVISLRADNHISARWAWQTR